MAWAFVRQNNYTDDTAYSTSTIGLNIAAVNGGSTLILCINIIDGSGANNDTISSITDGDGNTWQKAVDSQFAAHGYYTGIWFAANVVGDTLVPVTIHLNVGSGTSKQYSVRILEYASLSSVPLDVVASLQTASGTSFPTGTTAATAQANELAIAVYADNQQAPAVTLPGGWTSRLNFTSDSTDLAIVEKDTGSIGTQSATFTSVSTHYATGLIATFKTAAQIVVLPSGFFSSADWPGPEDVDYRPRLPLHPALRSDYVPPPPPPTPGIFAGLPFPHWRRPDRYRKAGPLLSSYEFVLLGQTYTQDVSEFTTTSDDVSRISDAARPLSETVVTSDSVARTVTYIRGIGETVTPATDSVVSTEIYARAVSESIAAASDSVNRTAVAGRSVGEAVTAASDSPARTFTGIRAIIETITAASDFVLGTHIFNRTIAETLTAASDVVTRVVAFKRSPSETITSANDALARQVTNLRSPSETISGSDAIARTFTGSRAVAETIPAATDSVFGLRVQVRSPTETLTAAADVVSRVFTGARAITETVTTSDVVTRVASFKRAVAETITAAFDAISRAVTYVRTAIETITAASDVVTGIRQPGRLITETITAASDAVARLFTGARIVTESTSTSSTVSRQVTASRLLSETVVVNDALVRAYLASRAISETVPAASDGVVRHPTYARFLSETVPATADSIARQLTAHRLVTETIPAASDVISIIFVPGTLDHVVPQLRDFRRFISALSDRRLYLSSLSDRQLYLQIFSDLISGQPIVGPNLVANDHGQNGNNSNWSQFLYDATVLLQGAASFKIVGANAAVNSDALMPIDYTRRYSVSLWTIASTFVADSHAYFGVMPFDIDNLFIDDRKVMWLPGTLTQLAADLHPGDPTISLVNAAGWHNGTTIYQRSILVWDYVDGHGQLWAPSTYSRHRSADSLWPQGGISGNVITLGSPWVGFGSVIPAGTYVSNGSAGGTYMYVAGANVVVPNVWTKYQGIIPGGYDSTGTGSGINGWRPGSTQAKILVLANRDTAGNVTNISYAALAVADAVSTEAALKDSRKFLTALADFRR